MGTDYDPVLLGSFFEPTPRLVRSTTTTSREQINGPFKLQ
ncbi:hypothetical protein SynPROS91_01957 [Synechococcus sp. PROS-9-1]|nr:hypothetical protein SynPROS91_01957 [Synechococcus sp. PROS-9-1]